MADKAVMDLPEGLRSLLDIVAKAYPGVSLSIPKEWADVLIRRFELAPVQRRGDMTGEKSCVFKWKDQDIRLALKFPHRWCLYHGDWESDSRWTGD